MAAAVQEIAGFTVQFHEVIPSTNTLALECRAHRTGFVARQQTQGRGRRGNSWVSRPDLGLYLSVCLEGQSGGLTMAAALAVRDALAGHVPVTVKWPNDLLCGGQKLCGILVEHRQGWNALGIGINLNHGAEAFPDTLRLKATSLLLQTGRDWTAEEVLVPVLEQLDRWLARLAGDFDAVHGEWVRACGLVGRVVQREGISGRVEHIDASGNLVVRTHAGTVLLPSTDAEYVACETVGALSCSS